MKFLVVMGSKQGKNCNQIINITIVINSAGLQWHDICIWANRDRENVHYGGRQVIYLREIQKYGVNSEEGYIEP